MLIVQALEHMIANGQHRWLLSAIKGLRNGIVYGAKIRFPHALVMTFLFAKGTLADKLRAILRATFQHAKNLGTFVFFYKLFGNILEKVQGQRFQWHSFISAFVTGYYVFGENNGVNMQINLYLLSRVTVGLVRLAHDKGIVGKVEHPVFPWFAATVWGVVLWLFEYHKPVLQPSLQNSMTYLYNDSDQYRNFDELFWVNKLETTPGSG